MLRLSAGGRVHLLDPLTTPSIYCQAMGTSTYEGIRYESTLPRAAMDARAETRTGTLTIAPDAVSFQDSLGYLDLSPVHNVAIGRRGSDLFNRWIKVSYGEGVRPATAFLNDGRWRGWRPLLTRSNRKIVSELRSQTR
jgi:hypothetical protein